MVAKKSVYRAVMTVLDTASPGAASRFFPSSPRASGWLSPHCSLWFWAPVWWSQSARVACGSHLVELRFRPLQSCLHFLAEAQAGGRLSSGASFSTLSRPQERRLAGHTSASIHSMSSSVFHLMRLRVGSGRVLTSALPSAGLCRGGE